MVYVILLGWLPRGNTLQSKSMDSIYNSSRTYYMPGVELILFYTISFNFHKTLWIQFHFYLYYKRRLCGLGRFICLRSNTKQVTESTVKVMSDFIALLLSQYLISRILAGRNGQLFLYSSYVPKCVLVCIYTSMESTYFSELQNFLMHWILWIPPLVILGELKLVNTYQH